MASVLTFPRFVIIIPYDMKHSCLGYADGIEGVPPHSLVLETEEGVHNPYAKIEMEPAKSDSRYVHLRLCRPNKYCSRAHDVGTGGCLVACSDQPEEDRTKLSCTLFEPVKATDGIDGYNMYLIHVQTGLRLQLGGVGGDNSPFMLAGEHRDGRDKMRFLDWGSIVKLPEHVAFKVENGKYVQVVWSGGQPYLQTSSDDPYDVKTGFRVYHASDGYVRIKSDDTGNFWKLSPDWIWANSSRSWSYDNLDDAFWPTKINGNTIVFQNGKNNKYLIPLSDHGKKNCLNASATTATKSARMAVEELVQERKIYRLIYRMDQARIFDKTPFMAATTTVTNNDDREASMEVEVGYEDEKVVTFDRSMSISAGVTISIEASAPEIFSASFQGSYSKTDTFEFGEAKTKRTSVKAKGTVRVPARSVAVVHYVGTKATCDVPYSYTQEDKSSTDGQISYSTHNDGIFTGVACYDFDFIVDKALPI